MFWLTIWCRRGYEVPIQLSGFQAFSSSAVSNVFVCPGLLLLLAFDWFFMSFVQRVTHVQNMSTAVYYWDLCVLHRRVFSLFLWIWQSFLLSMAMFVQKTEGYLEKAIRGHNLFSPYYQRFMQHDFESLYHSFLHLIHLGWKEATRRGAGAAQYPRDTSETRDCPQSRMSPSASSPSKIMLTLSIGQQAVLQGVEVMWWLLLGFGAEVMAG